MKKKNVKESKLVSAARKRGVSEFHWIRCKNNYFSFEIIKNNHVIRAELTHYMCSGMQTCEVFVNDRSYKHVGDIFLSENEALDWAYSVAQNKCDDSL